MDHFNQGVARSFPVDQYHYCMCTEICCFFFFVGGGVVLRHSAVQTDFEFKISGSLAGGIPASQGTFSSLCWIWLSCVQEQVGYDQTTLQRIFLII